MMKPVASTIAGSDSCSEATPAYRRAVGCGGDDVGQVAQLIQPDPPAQVAQPVPGRRTGQLGPQQLGVDHHERPRPRDP